MGGAPLGLGPATIARVQPTDPAWDEAGSAHRSHHGWGRGLVTPGEGRSSLSFAHVRVCQAWGRWQRGSLGASKLSHPWIPMESIHRRRHRLRWALSTSRQLGRVGPLSSQCLSGGFLFRASVEGTVQGFNVPPSLVQRHASSYSCQRLRTRVMWKWPCFRRDPTFSSDEPTRPTRQRCRRCQQKPSRLAYRASATSEDRPRGADPRAQSSWGARPPALSPTPCRPIAETRPGRCGRCGRWPLRSSRGRAGPLAASPPDQGAAAGWLPLPFLGRLRQAPRPVAACVMFRLASHPGIQSMLSRVCFARIAEYRAAGLFPTHDAALAIRSRAPARIPSSLSLVHGPAQPCAPLSAAPKRGLRPSRCVHVRPGL